MGSRAYALQMAELLDPEKEYFFTSTSSSKITSRDDHSSPGQKKCLNLVRGCQNFNVLILDDIRNAWTKKNQDNLIVMQKYYFFKSTCHLNNVTGQSHAELRTDESGYLEHILRCLKRIHDIWTNNPIDIDVRQRSWELATCSSRADASSVTHVVAINARTKNDLLALKNKFLVCPQWIEAASYLWEKQPEHKFSIFN
ncbi:RNA polymerase II C-terminal domain phosphatase-like 4 [Rosa rugosa]|uniref:RNA polymerase II C-terminal domain phosphatase-like 4 n=1 Tax=Rosa rugosa TaxID=74645 RepID=UPI002B4029AD|nr:RNA polymerase II C-terminal domain phosphatase-like 4 [Rosa rugosa]